MARILVAEDDPGLVEMMTMFLRSRGHEVVSVQDGMRAAEKALEFRPDLILSDIQMPNVYGTTAYQLLQRNPATAGIPVLFVTGVPRQTAEEAVPKGPKVRLLLKPVDLKRLEAAVNELLG